MGMVTVSLSLEAAIALREALSLADWAREERDEQLIENFIDVLGLGIADTVQ